METNLHSDSFLPPINEDVIFTIEDIQKFKHFSDQLLYISNSLKDVIDKYL